MIFTIDFWKDAQGRERVWLDENKEFYALGYFHTGRYQLPTCGREIDVVHVDGDRHEVIAELRHCFDTVYFSMETILRGIEKWREKGRKVELKLTLEQVMKDGSWTSFGTPPAVVPDDVPLELLMNNGSVMDVVSINGRWDRWVPDGKIAFRVKVDNQPIFPSSNPKSQIPNPQSKIP